MRKPNLASLEHQGMKSLRNIIRKVISPDDVYNAIIAMKRYHVDAEINAKNVANYLLLPLYDFYHKIKVEIKMHHPSLDDVMIDAMPFYQKRKPQEIDLSRIEHQISKVYNDNFIENIKRRLWKYHAKN